jgi:2-oxoglutarate dehydrogenase E2 component (dihydrolipoamide succinyltransferase)
MPIDVVVPTLGESLTSVVLARWLKNVGDRVQAGEPVVSVDSDKASMDVPSPAAGTLAAHLAAEGDEVAIGAIIARIEAGDGVAAPAAPAHEAAATATTVRTGPAARQAASRDHVDLKDVTGTGRRGRVTTEDVSRARAPAPVAAAPLPAPAPAPVAPPSGGKVQRVRMTPLRRTIARRLVQAQQTAAILTTFNEIDMSAVMALRARHQDRFVARHGIKLGFMSFFVKASIEALKEFPAVNAQIDGDDILYHQEYHIGVAVSAPRGLVVPVVQNADQRSFADLEKAIAELGKRARDGSLLPSDFEGGTFTISNGGVFGSLMSTPILNPPQSGILGMHSIQDRPVGRDGQVVLRPMMYVALSYDHRLIDGREAVGFLVRVKELVEAPERILLEA